MKEVVVQVDVDGVLADWTRGFTDLARGLWGPDVCPELQESTAEKWTDASMFTPNSRYRDTWEALLNCDNWWTSLKPMVFGDEFKRLYQLGQRVPVYYVTNRWHHKIPANLQTTFWLQMQGAPQANVITTREKGAIAQVLRVTHSLEDKWENACEIDAYIGPAGRSYLINRLHNQRPFCSERRVDTVKAFLDIVEKEL